MTLTVQPGQEKFIRYRQENGYYVDKTGFLETFLTADSSAVTLFTRPRRFGKTLLLSMMAEFLDITKESSALFEGLAISRNEKLCQEWMNHYPVIFLTLKESGAESYDEACWLVLQRIRDLCQSYAVLLDSPEVGSVDKGTLEAVLSGKNCEKEVQVSLSRLCSALYSHYKKPAVLLIDDYDDPVVNAYMKSFADKMISFMRVFLSESLQTNSSLKLSVLTGCLNISGESLFAGVNNLNIYDITHHEYADTFGFTEDEVHTMLEAFGMADKKVEVREWYDGYSFGDKENIYCPWDITRYVRDHVTRHDAEPKAYWLTPSGNDLARDVLAKPHIELTEKIGDLVPGGYVRFRLRTLMNYADTDSSESCFWSLMFMAGYLTWASEAELKHCSGLYLDKGEILCCIPNRVLVKFWQKQVQQWFVSVIWG